MLGLQVCDTMPGREPWDFLLFLREGSYFFSRHPLEKITGLFKLSRHPSGCLLGSIFRKLGSLGKWQTLTTPYCSHVTSAMNSSQTARSALQPLADSLPSPPAVNEEALQGAGDALGAIFRYVMPSTSHLS